MGVNRRGWEAPLRRFWFHNAPSAIEGDNRAPAARGAAGAAAGAGLDRRRVSKPMGDGSQSTTHCCRSCPATEGMRSGAAIGSTEGLRQLRSFIDAVSDAATETSEASTAVFQA